MMPRAALVLALAFATAGASGCMFAKSNLPRPFVRAGSPVIHVKQVRDRQRSFWTMKRGTQVEVKVLTTKYTTIDLRTCQVIATASFEGAARELAWDPTTDDVWVALDAERGRARSLRGRTIELPDALRAHSEDWLDLPPNRVARDSADGTLWLWRVVSGSVDVIARQVPVLMASASVGARTVAVTRSDAPAGVEATIIDDVEPGGPLQIARRRLPVNASDAGSAHLIGKGETLAFLGTNHVEVFELAGGTRVKHYDLPHSGAVAWSGIQPSLLAFGSFDRDAAAGGAASQITVIDLDRDASRTSVLPGAFSSLSWIGPSPFLLVERRSGAGIAGRWLFDAGRAVTTPATTSGRDWKALDDVVVFLDGPEGARRAMALTPGGAGGQPLSNQTHVRFVSVEATSRSIVIASEPSDLSVYRADARRLDRCSEF